jgi:hypothetical protein
MTTRTTNSCCHENAGINDSDSISRKKRKEEEEREMN